METKIANFKSSNLHKHLENACKTGTLVFQGKDLEVFPENLQKVSATLRNLDLSNNKLTTIPNWIVDFKSLKTLNLSGNLISYLPEDIGQLSKLENLIVSNVWFISYSKCSIWRQISKLLSNFGCLFTFCYSAWAN